MRTSVNLLASSPGLIFGFLASRLVWPRLLKLRKGLEIEGELSLNGFPIIDLRGKAKIKLGRRVKLNSWNAGYHVNLQAPVKLYAEGDGAEIVVGENTRIHGSCLHACGSIRVGRNCLIAGNVQIFDTNGHELSFPDVDNRLNTIDNARPVVIEDSVWIGINSIIMPGVRIGRGSVVGAGSIVTRDVPSMVVVAGNPARIIKDFRSSHDAVRQ